MHAIGNRAAGSIRQSSEPRHCRLIERVQWPALEYERRHVCGNVFICRVPLLSACAHENSDRRKCYGFVTRICLEGGCRVSEPGLGKTIRFSCRPRPRGDHNERLGAAILAALPWVSVDLA